MRVFNSINSRAKEELQWQCKMVSAVIQGILEALESLLSKITTLPEQREHKEFANSKRLFSNKRFLERCLRIVKKQLQTFFPYLDH